MVSTLILTVVLTLLATLQDGQAQFSITPTDVTVNEAESASVECSYNNTTAISWQRVGGDPITDSSEGFQVTTDEGVSTLSISAADPQLHTGQYVCIAGDLPGGGEESAMFNITVQFIRPISLVVMLNPCAEGVVYVENDVTLQCPVPDAVPEVTSVSWFRMHDSAPTEIRPGDFPNINVSDQLLNITSITSEDTAVYFCRVSNGPVTRDSDTRLLSVITSPPGRELVLFQDGRRLVDDQQLLVKEGNITSILCSITPPSPSFPTANVFWSRDSATLVSGRSANLFVSSMCEFILVIQNTTSENVGHYRCHLGSLHVGVILTLATIPATYSVTASPNTMLLGVERDITFTCVESPPGQVHNVDEVIKWQFRGSGGGEPRDVEGDRFVVSEIARSLTIRELQVDDSGTYFCVAGHPLVTPILTPISLQVEAKYDVTITPINPPAPVVKLGTPLVLRCSADAPRDVTFSWAVNGSPILSGGRFNIVSDPASFQSTLNITEVLEEDLGVVRCTVSDPLHVPLSDSIGITETGLLYLFGDRRTAVHNVREGTVIRLECPIRASSPATTVLWFTGSRLLLNGSGVSLERLANGSAILQLGLASVVEDDGDQYLCEVKEGSVNLNYTITIYVTTPGNISKFPPLVTNATEGSRVQLDCEASGRPRPTVTWLRGDTPVTELNSSAIMDVGNGSLIFESVRVEDTGDYTCFIENPSVVHSTTLRVLQDGGGGGGVLGLNMDETILVFVMVGVVGFFLLLMCPLLVIISCYCCLYRMSTGKYMVNKHGLLDSSSFKQNSLRGGSLRGGSLQGGKDNSGVLMGTPTPIFTTLQRSPEAPPPSTLDDRYEDSIPMNSFMVGVGPAGSASLLTESHTSSPARGTAFTTPSHNSVSSPIHPGTMASTSIFSSEEHTMMENGLPNFPRNNVKLQELMGQGEFGPVMKAVAKNLVPGEAETEVAVKLLVTEAVEDTGFRADLAIVDYANQMKLEYKNIASILGICSDEEPFYVIYEYLDRGDLKNFLLSSRPQPGAPPQLMDHELLRMIGQVADGMAYLFSQRIIHGDIATRNCLVSSSLQVKIGDLGIGHELYTGDYYDNGAQLLPIRWMPPELLTDSEEGPSFSLHSDAWSFGVFCWEVMAYARLPYDNYSDEEVLAMVPAGSRLRNPGPNCPPALFLVMMDCWHEEPERRPQFNKILSDLAIINLEQS